MRLARGAHGGKQPCCCGTDVIRPSAMLLVLPTPPVPLMNPATLSEVWGGLRCRPALLHADKKNAGGRRMDGTSPLLRLGRA
eukprot:8133107-Alexandrium_andersonii.AAC.1